jgi:predicted glycosyltransferase involved in capsule biosynthesis
MMDLAFLIPIRIETEDRLKNIISSVSYLLKHIPAKVIVKEVSDRPTFQFRALPEIKKYASTENLIFLHEESDDPLFCKSKVLNDLIIASGTKVVANYDADCILPISSYHQAYDVINDNQADVVYPYGCGIYQWKANYNMQIYEEFINQLDTSVLDKHKTLSNSTIGWTQFVNRQKYIDSYMMNENFVSWGCEDDEFYFRMSLLGNRIARIDNYVYHLEHSRTHNSWFSNPNFNNNWHLWNIIKTFDKEQLIMYYENQEYFAKRRGQLK